MEVTSWLLEVVMERYNRRKCSFKEVLINFLMIMVNVESEVLVGKIIYDCHFGCLVFFLILLETR